MTVSVTLSFHKGSEFTKHQIKDCRKKGESPFRLSLSASAVIGYVHCTTAIFVLGS